MQRAVAARCAIARGAEAHGLAGKDRFEGIAAGLREQHFGADAFRHRQPIEMQCLGDLVQACLHQQPAQRLPELCVDRLAGWRYVSSRTLDGREDPFRRERDLS